MVRGWNLVAAAIPTAAMAVGITGVAHAETPLGCTAADVTISLGAVDAGAGSRYAPLLVTAHSGVVCTLSGYGTRWSFRDGQGAKLATEPHRYQADDQPTVVVTDSTPASIDLHWIGIPAADGDDSSQPAPATLHFRLPGAKADSVLPWTGGQVFDHGFLEHKPASSQVSE